jgi:hypothetical protein
LRFLPALNETQFASQFTFQLQTDDLAIPINHKEEKLANAFLVHSKSQKSSVGKKLFSISGTLLRQPETVM